MKGKVILSVLEKLAEAATEGSALFEAILTAGYGASMGKLDYKISLIKMERSKKRAQAELEWRSRRTYNSLLYKLKRDGFMESNNKNGKKFFSITPRGKKKLDILLLRKTQVLPRINYNVVPEEKNNLLIVAFDIPEKERRKRDWLRSSLRHLGLKMIQKSVWIGKIKLPDDFIKDIGVLNLAQFVHIFEVGKEGSLRDFV